MRSMKKIKLYTFAAIAMFIGSCSNFNNYVPTFKSNFNLKGDWINYATIGKFGGANGEYCSKVDSIHDYSYGFSKAVSEISPKDIKKIKVSLKVKLTDIKKKLLLVVSVFGPENKNYFWSGHDLHKMVSKVNEWTTINTEDLIPDFDAKDASVGVLVWNPNKTTAYIDDYEIRFLNE
jgi:hypothetical protein